MIDLRIPGFLLLTQILRSMNPYLMLLPAYVLVCDSRCVYILNLFFKA